MVILAVIIVLLILLLASTWSSARSYFAKGRLAGMEEATLEIIRGINSHYAHLGFKKMMPNDRGIEMHRFDGEEHALEGTRAVERLEWAIPEKHRPSDHSGNRQALIRHWWPLERKSA